MRGLASLRAAVAVPGFVLIGFGALAALFAGWRAVVAAAHYRASLAVLNDPSIRELEEVAAFINGGVALLALLHAAGAFALVRRPPALRPGALLAVALLTGVWVAGGLAGSPLLWVPGAYPGGIALGVFAIGAWLGPSWLSAYLGSVAGAVAGCLWALPDAGVWVLASVAGPCVAFTALGAAGAQLLARRRKAGGPA
jgi:hypothetical protein